MYIHNVSSIHLMQTNPFRAILGKTIFNKPWPNFREVGLVLEGVVEREGKKVPAAS